MNPTQEDEAALDATKAPLMEHLLELRTRLIWAVVSFGVAFIVSFIFAKPIFNFLTRPLHDALRGQENDHLIYTALTEVFFTNVKIGMFGGICLGFPAIAAQLWIFVAPGLYRHEKRAFLPFLIATPFMFALGAAFVYYVMLPFSIHFFAGFQVEGTANTMGVQLQAKVSEYLELVMTLIFAFGLTFQLPVLLAILGKIGIVSSKALREMRRYAIVGLFAVAAVFTPPDAISMLALAVPLTLLYEVSIWLVIYFERQRAREDAAREAETSGETTSGTDVTPA
ncbi:MAG TPA: twin-arginine translocase subunit TatC [Rhizomicrobium sp.]|nr:twin-arginine translocase subunit TatC [Rhizomicrobium sp.]